MSSPKIYKLLPEDSNISGELSDFNKKAKIFPPVMSTYLALGIAYLQTLFRLRDQNFCQPTLAALDTTIQQAEEVATQWPDRYELWAKFQNLKNTLLQADKTKLFMWWQKYIETNAKDACLSIDVGIRILMCKIIDKDFKYGNILNEPLNARDDYDYFRHFCNKLRVNILLVTETQNNYIARDDMNKSPLVSLYMENDATLSVLYHKDYFELEAGTPFDNLDKFPFVYDPRAAEPKRESIRNLQAVQSPSPTSVSSILPESSGPRLLKKFPMPPNKQDAPTNEISKRLISSMASIFILSDIEDFNDDFIKDFNDYLEMDPSANTGDVARLKKLIEQLRAPIPPEIPQSAGCGHPPVKYTPFCGNEHCAYCLKEIIDRDKLKAACEHGKKISAKNANEIGKLLESPPTQRNEMAAKVGNGGDSRGNIRQTIDMPDLGPALPSNVNPRPTSLNINPIQMPPREFKVSQMPGGPPKASPIPDPPKKLESFPSEGSQIPTKPIKNPGIPPVMGGSNQPTNINQPPVIKKIPEKMPPQQGFAPQQIGLQMPKGPQPGFTDPPYQQLNKDLGYPQNSQVPPRPNFGQMPLSNFGIPMPGQQVNPQPWAQNAQIPGPMQPNLSQMSQPGQQLNPSWAQNAQTRPQEIANPGPKNENECAHCYGIKSSEDFSIACSGHKVCNVCRIQNLTQCIICDRFYSDDQQEYLQIVQISFTQ